MLIREVLSEAKKQLATVNGDEHIARILLMDILQIESYQLWADLDTEMSDSDYQTFTAMLNRFVVNHEPVQYIVGFEYFCGRNLIVNEDVLIPRPETEELVYKVLETIDDYFEDYQALDVVDVGTGSGAIAVSVAAEEPRVHMWASDISEAAVAVAKRNAAEFAPGVEFLLGDMTTPFIEAGLKFDILLSNPPYIPDEETVDSLVKENEPHVALFGGNDGLRFYKQILSTASSLLKERSVLAFEIGFDQAERLVAVASEHFPDAIIRVLKDINGKDRMLFVYNNIELIGDADADA
ncbi:peptide chain release factor N(5)-glutamine methyltransferase [Culicoidibacter larvae]|uniref:Release factor glutamine methyltransferase n=1 Tax=Culicoidibacter larvae TaxID=2579976 RepID=A0A5R8QBJ2_9FIRM|nr:peptide chain release factor N(5)-glutamine methyltransferase [Culicoidibacter larvae]TLG73949.1 peptide chain release factor N(5)-glutamine methyltransferase [Culicoidibacter larvae]